jgi:hypothetical protein
MRRLLLSFLAVALCATEMPARAADAGDRTSRRSAELALPDPYLDPAWPDPMGEEMEGRYAPGKSDSVEDTPLDEELEMQEEQRALEELTGEGAPPASAPAGASPAVASPGPPAADASEDAPQEQGGSDDAGDNVERAPDMEERDPVEW